MNKEQDKENEYKQAINAELKKRMNYLDFDDVDEYSRLPKSLEPVIDGDADDLHKFNAAIADLHKKKLINITDSLIYLTTDYLDEKQVLKYLDELNFYTLKQELLKRFHVKKDKPETSLLEFLDADDE